MPPPTQPNMGVIMERITNIQCDVSEIKKLLTEHVEAQTKFEQETISSRATTKEQITSIQGKVKEHEEKLSKHEEWQKNTEKILGRLAVTDAILRWVAVILMGSVITLIWGVLTHQVVLNFP